MLHPVAFVADLHIGNKKKFGGPSENSLNQRCREAIATIDNSVAQALEFDTFTYYMLGDIFDTARPIPPMVALTHDALHPFVRGGRPVIALVGNHDKQSSDLEDHALASMKRSNTIDCIAEATLHHISDSAEFVSIPYHEGDAREWLPAELAKLFGAAGKAGMVKRAPRALCIHLGVYTEKYTAFIGGRSARDAVPVSLLGELMEQYDCDACFAGNWHARKVFKTKTGKPIVQVGSLCPTGWSDKGLTGHGMSSWDPNTNEVQHIEVNGPRFLVLPRGMEEAKAALKKLEKHVAHHHLYIRAIAEDREEMVILRDAIEAMGGTADIQLDKVLAQAAARTAATVAKSAETRGDALGAYVKAMMVDDEVDKAAVLERCKRYLNA